MAIVFHRERGERNPEVPEATTGGTWFAGKGEKGLQEARQQLGQGVHADAGREHVNSQVVEGTLDGKVVYREFSPGGSVPSDMNEVPEGREDEVSYSRVEYQG